MAELTIFEEMGVQYEEKNGLFYPLIDMGADVRRSSLNIDVGKYGRAWLKYMNENEPARFRTLYRYGKLYDKAAEVNEEAYRILDKITAAYLKSHLMNLSSTMEQWKLREQAKVVAEEEIYSCVVNSFH